MLEEVKNSLDLAMIRMGADFETFGGAKVKYKGFEEKLLNWVPVGSVGEIIYTWPGSFAEVQVKWKGVTSLNGLEDPIYAHQWSELDLLAHKR